MPAATNAVNSGNAGNMGRFMGAMVGGPIGAMIGGGIGDAIDRRRAERKQRDAYNASLTDRTLTIRGGVTPRRLVLGRARLSGTLMYADTVGPNKSMLDTMLALCDGPIDAIEGYWLGDEYFSTADLSGDRPSTGKYATPAVTVPGYTTAILTSQNTLTLAGAPVGNVVVSLDLGGDNGYTTVAVASVAGAVVTLAETVTGRVHADYQYIQPSAAPLRIQWRLGDQTAASSWSGVTTPGITSTDVARGVAYVRTLMAWDENLYAQGPPAVGVLARGVRDVFDPRYNLNPSALLQGAVVGTPGTLPPGVIAFGPAGLAFSVVAQGTDATTGLPYVSLRVQGTATADGNVVVKLPTDATAPAAANGQTWGARAHIGRVAGVWPAGVALHVGSLVAATSWATAGSTAVADTAGQWVSLTATIARTGTTQASAALRFAVTTGQVLDVTVRIALPMLWRTDIGAPMRWTSNPALLAAWYAVLPRLRNGCGRPWALVDWASVAAAANVCDELITVRKRDGSGYEQIKRYECHTVLGSDAAPGNNLRIVLDTMLGEFPFTGGKYTMFAGAHRSPTLTLTDADISADAGIRFFPANSGFEHIPTSVSAEYADAAQMWREASPPVVRNAAYVAAAGAEEISAMRLPATTDARQANYLMGVMLERMQPNFGMEVTVTWRGADMSLLDALQLDLAGYSAMAAFTWEVRARRNNFDGTYTLRLGQTKANMWALDADRYTPTTVPTPPDLSYLWSVAPVSSMGATAPAPTLLPDGTAVALATVSWASHSQDYVRQSGAIELRYRRVESAVYSGATEVPGNATSTTITLAASDKARYIIEVRARNGVGAVGPWAVVALDVAIGSAAISVPAQTADLAPQSVTEVQQVTGTSNTATTSPSTVVVVDGLVVSNTTADALQVILTASVTLNSDVAITSGNVMWAWFAPLATLGNTSAPDWQQDITAYNGKVFQVSISKTVTVAAGSTTSFFLGWKTSYSGAVVTYGPWRLRSELIKR